MKPSDAYTYLENNGHCAAPWIVRDQALQCTIYELRLLRRSFRFAEWPPCNRRVINGTEQEMQRRAKEAHRD